MAMKECFRAADPIFYTPGGAGPYNGYLLTPPRIYGEEFQTFSASNRVGALWTTPDENVYAPSTIFFLAPMAQVAYPSWSISRWRFDAQRGRFVMPDGSAPVGALGSDGSDHERFDSLGAVVTSFGSFAVEPDGSLWVFEYNPIIGGPTGGAQQLDRTTLALIVGSAIDPAAWLDARGNVPVSILDFSIDRVHDRLFVRWNTNNVGEVSIYQLSTKTWLADIWTPNATVAIVLTDTQFIYVADGLDYIVCYDYSGTPLGWTRNPRRAAIVAGASGLVYGWDRQYKRLLCARLYANGTDGHSRCRIAGFYPTSDAQALSAPIPIRVPRKGRTVQVFSHLYGEGAEPIAARQVKMTGDPPTAQSPTDADGDALLPITPGGAGAFGVTMTAAADPTPAEPVEP